MIIFMGRLSDDAIINDPAQMSRNPQQAMAQMGKCLDPRMLKQIGGMSGLQNLMKSMNGMDPSQLMGMMGE